MPPAKFSIRFALASLLTITAAGVAVANPVDNPTATPADQNRADQNQADQNQADQNQDNKVAAASSKETKSSGGSASESKPKPKYPPLATLTKDLEPVDGMLKLYRGDTKLLAELRPSDLNRDHIVLITIARGIGQTPILGGFSWGFGNDAVWQFKKRGERIHVVRRNVRFRADAGSPSAEAVKLAYTDSVLFSLPIAGRGSGGSYIVDLGGVFLSDLPQISQVLPGFAFSRSKSTWADVKGFDKNIEVQVAATYASSGSRSIETVADTRGVTVNVHYSISRLPKTSYRPRLGDDRVGYFVAAIKDFSKPDADDRFLRYITRWDLQKSDTKADKSPPKEPIVFWLEKTIPYKYRKPIRDGIEEWNKAFEQAGFYNAIDVRQQPDDADWEPGDIRFNTFRWITAGAGFAMGPSRVNPLTGQILDADVIFDADFLSVWRDEYETFTPEGIALMTGGPITIEQYREHERRLSRLGHRSGCRCGCNLLSGMSRQLALGATLASARQRSDEDLEKLQMQALKEVTMHEIGHTLGLRHNFKASTQLGVDELHDVTKTSKTGVSASVMDYNPANFSLESEDQGDYYSTTIGPYDYWAIEYGYKPLKNEKEGLAKIAARSGEPGLAYGTDEDTRGIDPDPHSWRFDLGDDLVAYAERQAALVAQTLPGIIDNLVEEGEGYQRARRAFGVLLATHANAVYMASRYIGGLHVSRSHKGDAGAAEPFAVVSAERQRAAMKLIGEQLLSDQPFNIPPELYNKLIATRWDHWGASIPYRNDYPVHDVILLWQERVLDRLLSPLTLSRLHDSELKTPADEDAFTTAELIAGLTDAVFDSLGAVSEGSGFTPRKPAVSSLDRNLQRAYLDRLIRLAVRGGSAPEDCKTLAFVELQQLEEQLGGILDDHGDELDAYSRAHLVQSRAKAQQALEAQMIALP